MAIGRREFLGTLTMASCTLAGVSKVSANENFKGYSDRFGMLIDTTQCIGNDCRLCEDACKKRNKLSLDDLDLTDNSVFDKIRRTDSNNYTVVNKYKNPDKSKDIFVKFQCMQCNEPACASACLVKAFTKTPEGSVVYNKDVCIGCRYCMVACPFYTLTYDYNDAFTPQVRKCTMCFERIKGGQKPACVEACPKESITFGKRKDLITLAHEKIRNHPNRYIDHVYGEIEVGGTSVLYLAETGFSNLGFDTELGDTPYPLYTRGFLSSVPLVLAIWPVLLVGLYKASQDRNSKVSQVKINSEDGGEL